MENPCFLAKCHFSHLGGEKGPAVQPSTQHGKGPLKRGHGFPHSLQHFETLFCTQYIHQLSKSRGRPMPSLKMSHQGLFGCVTPDTLNTMKLHPLSTTLKMEVWHNPGSQDFATIFTGISSIQSPGNIIHKKLPQVDPGSQDFATILTGISSIQSPGNIIHRKLPQVEHGERKKIPHPWFQLTPTSPSCPSLGPCYVPDSSLS